MSDGGRFEHQILLCTRRSPYRWLILFDSLSSDIHIEDKNVGKVLFKKKCCEGHDNLGAK